MAEPTALGLDYSWGRPTGKAVKAAGYKFVCRYADYPGAGGKGLTAAEADDLHANSLGIVAVFESTANRALGGYTAGIVDARLATQGLIAAGFPVDYRPVYFAVDFDAQPEQYPAIDAYLAGAKAGMQRGVGVYGSYQVVEHCSLVKSADWFWQTYAWSGGKKSEARNIYQFQNGVTLNGAEVDQNEAYGEGFGAWFPLRLGGGQVTEMEYENLLLALYAGSEAREPDGTLMTREKRLGLARYRVGLAASGGARSVWDVAASASPLGHGHEATIELT